MKKNVNAEFAGVENDQAEAACVSDVHYIFFCYQLLFNSMIYLIVLLRW